jgi:hypothetical protein
MTWLGKILTFVVMIAAVVWMYFTVQAYVTRTNFKTALEKWKASYEAISVARSNEVERNRSSEEALRKQIADVQARADSLQKQISTLEVANKNFVNDFKTQQEVLSKGDVDNTIISANLAANLKELDAVRKRSNELEDKTTQLVIDAENAKREMVKAQNEARLYRSNADDLGKKVEELAQQNNELKQSGGSLRGLLDRPAPAVLANLRGEVESVSKDGSTVTLSIGADAGLSKGTVLELSRLTEGGKYLGTVKVIDLEYKKAVAVFTPATSVPLSRLKPDDLPKKGDQVRPRDSVVSGR